MHISKEIFSKLLKYWLSAVVHILSYSILVLHFILYILVSAIHSMICSYLVFLFFSVVNLFYYFNILFCPIANWFNYSTWILSYRLVLVHGFWRSKCYCLFFHTYRISFPLLFDHNYSRYCTDDDVEHRNVCLAPINSLVYFVYSFIEIT